MDAIKSVDAETLKEVVCRAARIKTEIVEKDEKDLDLRHILNYGHTVGHAIESASDFRVRHGRAIAIGMVATARISNKLGIFNQNELARLESLISRSGLPTEIPNIELGKIVEAIKHDKKISQSKMQFVLPRTIGDVFLTDEVSFSLIEQVLAS